MDNEANSAVVSGSLSVDPDKENTLRPVFALFELLSDIAVSSTVSIQDNTADNLPEGWYKQFLQLKRSGTAGYEEARGRSLRIPNPPLWISDSQRYGDLCWTGRYDTPLENILELPECSCCCFRTVPIL